MDSTQTALDALEAAGKDAMTNRPGIASLVYLPGNLAAPLAAVVRAVADRPWWCCDADPDPDAEVSRLTCIGCEAEINEGDSFSAFHDVECRYAPADAALDAFAVAAQEMFP